MCPASPRLMHGVVRRIDDTERNSKHIPTVLYILSVLPQMARVSSSISDLSDEARVKTPPSFPSFDPHPLSSHPRQSTF